MPTPNGVNYLLQFLMICLIPQLSKARIKSGRSVLCPILFYLSIGIQFFVKLAAKIINLWHIAKSFLLNKVVLLVYSLLFARKCLILQGKFEQWRQARYRAAIKDKEERNDRRTMAMAGAGYGMEGCQHISYYVDSAVAPTVVGHIGDTK